MEATKENRSINNISNYTDKKTINASKVPKTPDSRPKTTPGNKNDNDVICC